MMFSTELDDWLPPMTVRGGATGNTTVRGGPNRSRTSGDGETCNCRNCRAVDPAVAFAVAFAFCF
jgi:hypothetical protein